MSAKIIFHIDLNAFYASVEIIKEPLLKGKAFGIGNVYAGGNSGILSTASYEARKYGIKSAMTIGEAKRRYPKFTVVKPDYKSYEHYSNIFFNYLKKYSNLILKGSIDEAYVDMTNYLKDKDPLVVAKQIQDELLQFYQLPVSIGIAPTIFLAKMASDMKKPLGITVLRIKDIKKILFPLPVKELHGLGVKTNPKLEENGIKTIGDFTLKKNKNLILNYMSNDMYEDFLKSIFGASSNLINPAKYEIPQSISSEETLITPVFDNEEVFKELINLLLNVHKRLTNDNLLCRTVFIKYRYENFKTHTKSLTMNNYTDQYHLLYETLTEIYEQIDLEDAVRLIGAGVSNIIKKKNNNEEVNLFNYQNYNDSSYKISKTIEKLPEDLRKTIKFGKINKKEGKSHDK